MDGTGVTGVASVDRTEWQDAATVDGTGAGPSVDGTGVVGVASVDGTEWQNTASVDGTGAGPETEVEETWFLAHLEPSQLIDTSLEYPSRMWFLWIEGLECLCP